MAYIAGDAKGVSKDVLMGTVGNDYMHGWSDNDLLNGGAGSDLLYGDGGNDTLLGGSGFDILVGGPGNDYIDGGLDRDQACYGSNMVRVQKVGTNMYKVFGNQFTEGTDIVTNVEFLNLAGKLYKLPEDAGNEIVLVGQGHTQCFGFTYDYTGP